MHTTFHSPAEPGSETDHSLKIGHWKVVLEILRGQTRNRRRPIREPVFLLGTAADCDLVLGDERFAEVHACILVREQGVWIRHLGFEPEITVNGTALGRIQLDDGDIIRTGPYEFRISIRYQKPNPIRGNPYVILHGPHRLRVHPATVDAEIMATARQLLQDIRTAISVDELVVPLYAASHAPCHVSRYPVLPAGHRLANYRAKGA